MSVVLECRELTSGYGKSPVIRSMSLTVAEGEVVALLGPNGAGKTTTLLTVGGVLEPMEGEVSVLGQPVKAGHPELVARRGMAIVPDDRGLFFGLTCSENLRLARRQREIDVAEVIRYFPALERKMGVRAGLLSGGEQQMLALARALLTNPRLLVIDEMSLGLAPIIIERIVETVRRLVSERGLALLIVDQHVQVALEIADRAYVLSHGRIVLEGEADDLARRREVMEESYLGEAAFSDARPDLTASSRTGVEAQET